LVLPIGGEIGHQTATANSGYTFANWTENGSSVVRTSASYTFPIFTANFKIISLSASRPAGGPSANYTLTLTANRGPANCLTESTSAAQVPPALGNALTV
jgi:hypothetical protein